MPADDPDEIARLVRLACLMEVAAPKAGNVHPTASFIDASITDFVRSAEAIAPVLAQARSHGVGETILRCVRATRQVTQVNTNLGIILLLAPLCAVPGDVPLATGVSTVLERLTIDDAQRTYEAIRLAKPGGLGATADADVSHPPRISLSEAMALAADRDAVARQYVTSYSTVLNDIVGDLADDAQEPCAELSERIVHAHLRQMAREPDTLIRRKCGDATARESSMRAAAVLEAGWPLNGEGRRSLESLDAWLRADGHRRNPGTSADLIAAGLFVVMREGRLRPRTGWIAEWLT